MNNNVTRGHGLLEIFLARKRAQVADSLIPPRLRSGKIFDIGCGSYPYFLVNTEFREKFGLDQNFLTREIKGINFIKQNMAAGGRLPFADNYFNIVTLLAFLEHLEEGAAVNVLREARRVLLPSCLLIMTVPSGRADLLLRLMSKVGLVSAIEISEHKQAYNPRLITKQLLAASFKKESVKIKNFEFGLNLLALAKK